MRKRKEIEHSYKAPISCSPRGFEEIKIELLLDIRDLLVKLCDWALITEIPKEIKFMSHAEAIDCNVIPDRKKLVKMKEKLDKLLRMP